MWNFLANPEMSQRHFSPGERYSSDHADLDLRYGEDYGNVASISNHTGLAGCSLCMQRGDSLCMQRGEPINEKNQMICNIQSKLLK
jgi:hypothetical protein